MANYFVLSLWAISLTATEVRNYYEILTGKYYELTSIQGYQVGPPTQILKFFGVHCVHFVKHVFYFLNSGKFVRCLPHSPCCGVL